MQPTPLASPILRPGLTASNIPVLESVCHWILVQSTPIIIGFSSLIDTGYWIIYTVPHEEDFGKCAVFVQFLFILLLYRREIQFEVGKLGRPPPTAGFNLTYGDHS